MEIGNNNRFYVVEFLDPPYRGFDQYVCIPRSWVLFHDESKKLVVTKYPVEKSSQTEQRVKEGDVSSIEWSFYTANFKYRTDSYEEAKKYIETLENRVVMERNSPELMNEDDDENFSSNTKINESSFKDNVEPASEKLPLTNFRTEIQNKKTHVGKFAISTNKLTNQTPTSSKSLNDKQLLSTSKRTLDQSGSTRKICNETSNNLDRSEINDNPGGKTGNESFVNDNAPKSENESLDSTIVKKPIFGTGPLDFWSLIPMDKINRKTLSAQSTPINKTFAARGYDSTATTSKDTIALEVEEEEEREKERQAAKKTQVETGVLKRKEVVSDEREDDDDNHDILKKKRSEPRRFTLPPEFDKNDWRWTLQYRQPSSEAVELIEGSGIFVNAARLISCQRSTTDAKTLARSILTEIFTDSALRTCVFTVGKFSAYSNDGSTSRPGLDESAKAVLLEYVESYAQANNWPKVDREAIISTIRQKIRNVKRTRE